MKKTLLLLFSFLLGVFLFFWTAKTIGWHEIKNAFLVFTGWQGITILFLTVMVLLINALKWQQILKGNNFKIPFRDVFNFYLAGFSVMFLAPILVWGGEALRGYLLKRKYGVAWVKGMSSIFIDRLLEWSANLLIIFLGGLVFLLIIGLPPLKSIIIFGGLFLTLSSLIGYFYFKISKRESAARVLLKIFSLKGLAQKSIVFKIEREIFSFFKTKNKALKNVLLLTALRVVGVMIRDWLLILFLGRKIGLLPLVSILGFNFLATLVPIPTALGSHEALQSLAFGSLGLGTSTAAAFTMIIRTVELIPALFGLIVVFRFGIKAIKNLLKKTDSLLVENNFEKNNYN